MQSLSAFLMIIFVDIKVFLFKGSLDSFDILLQFITEKIRLLMMCQEGVF